MEKNIEILGAYEREFDKRKFIHYKEDDKEYLTDGMIRHNKDVNKIISVMNKMDKLPTEEIKEKNSLKETEGVIKALEKLEKGESQTQEQGKTKVALESTLDFQEPSAGFYTRLDGMDEKILYRLVKIAENGELEAYPDKSTLFENEEIAKEYIKSHASELEVVRYDDLIFQAGLKTVENEYQKSKEKSKEEKEEDKENNGNKDTGEQQENKEVEEVKNQLDKMYKEFEKSVINYLNETTISLDKTLFQKSMDNIRSSYDSMINVVEGKGPDKETSLVKESKGKESSLKKQMESYKTNVREIMGYMKQYHHNNSIYTQAGRVNIAKDLTDALNQVEKAMNHVTTILQQLPMQELHKEKGIMEKNIDSFTDVSMELYKNHGNFNCTMAYIKEYAKENGMSMSQEVLKNSNLESKFKANAREEIRGVFTQAVNVGDRQYLASVIKEAGFKPSNNLIDAMKNVNQHFGKDHSVKELKNLSQNQKNLLGNDKAVVKNAVDTFKHEESIMCKVKAILPGQ